MVHNAVKQAGLGFGAGIGIFDHVHLSVVLRLAAVLAVLNLVSLATHPTLPVGLAAVAATTCVLLWFLGPALDLEGTFPELARLPLLRRLVRPALPKRSRRPSRGPW